MPDMNKDEQQKRFDAAVNERVTIIAQASRLLPADFKFSLLSARQIREAALRVLYPARDYSSKGDDYVHGAFDDAIERAWASKIDARLDQSADRFRVPTWLEAQDRIAAHNREMPVPDWQTPLRVTRDDSGVATSSPRIPDWKRNLNVWKDDSGEVHGTQREAPSDAVVRAAKH